MYAIRQQHHDAIALGLDPQRRAGESRVTEGAWGEHLRRFAAGRKLPAQSTRVAHSRGVIANRVIDDRPRKQLGIDPRLGQSKYRTCGCEESCVPRHAAGEERVAVMCLAPDQTVARRGAVGHLRLVSLSPFRGRDARPELRRRIEHRIMGQERRREIAIQLAQRVPQQDEIEIGVDDLRAALTFAALLQNGLQVVVVCVERHPGTQS